MSIEGCYLRVLPEEISILQGCSLVTFEQSLGYLGDGLQRVDTYRFLDIGRDWQVFTLLLGAIAEPLTSSSVLSEANFGHGPIRYLMVSDVQLVFKALKSVTKPILRNQFDPAQLEAQRIYPGDWLLYQEEPLLSQRFESLWAKFESLLHLFGEAASADECVVCWLM